MTQKHPLFDTEETLEILNAAYSALDFAFVRASSLEFEADEVAARLAKSMDAVRAAWDNCESSSSVKGHVANALSHLRASLKAVHEKDDREAFSQVIRSSARALALLYPITQTSGPLLLVPRKNPARSRRKLPVASIGNRRRLSFDVNIGKGLETNFFTGLEGGISSGGLFVATYDIHPIGTKLRVRARMPGGWVISEEATVKWIREFNERSPDIAPGMGVTFDHLSEENRREIDSFLQGRETILYEAV